MTAIAAEPADGADQTSIDAILRIVRERTGVDFSCYRPATVRRRILNRMVSINARDFADYLGHVRAAPEEAQRLLERITIKVSRFYRHAPTFDRLRAEIIPRLAAARRGEPLRIWSVGCGCGEEAYTLAMLLDEAGTPGHIEASDVDPQALESARIGIYPATAMMELPRPLTERYLEPVPSGQQTVYRVRDVLRERLRFSHFDITSNSEAPGGGRFDLISCRNVLIYLQRQVQERILRFLHGSLVRGGFLCLGEAEWPPPSISSLLDPLPHKTRLFRTIDPPSPRDTRDTAR